MQAIIAQQEEGLVVECQHHSQFVGYISIPGTNECRLVGVKCYDCGVNLEHPMVKEYPNANP